MAKEISYLLSQEADKDLEDIFDYTVDKFGVDQAITYVSAFEDAFNNICFNPKLGRERDDIRPHLRSIAKESHVIFYRVTNSHVHIIRILHASRDITNHI